MREFDDHLLFIIYITKEIVFLTMILYVKYEN